jgi:hypothetical protein
MRPGIGHDRATAAQPPKAPRVHWDWPPEAQVEALLWLARQDPLLFYIFRVRDNLQALNKSFSGMLNLGLLSARRSGSSIEHYWSAHAFHRVHNGPRLNVIVWACCGIVGGRVRTFIVFLFAVLTNRRFL